jgi:hypothetical protein
MTKIFSGELRTQAGSLTTSVLGVNALEQMRRGDVVHVEGRILAQQDDIHLREIGAHGRAERVSGRPRRRAPTSGSTRADTAVPRMVSRSGV